MPAEVLRGINADFVNIVEVEDCTMLEKLNAKLPELQYKHYLIKGTDTATGTTNNWCHDRTQYAML